MKQFALLALLFFLLPNLLDAQVIFPKKSKGVVYYVDAKGKKINDWVFEEANRFYKTQSHASVKLNGLWGYVNTKGELAIVPMFEEAKNFAGGLAMVKKEGKYAVIDTMGNQVTKLYESMIYVNGGCMVKADGKYGLITQRDSVLIPIEFENYGGKTEGKYIVKSDGIWGYYAEGEFTPGDENMVFTRVDTKPYLLGNCVDRNPNTTESQCQTMRMLERLYKNIKYPPAARDAGVQGTVVVNFVINKAGEIENPVISKEIGKGCGDEALSVVKEHFSKWAKPAMIDGEEVRFNYRLPVKFKLE